MLTRRRWLAGGLAAALALVARRASAIGPGSKFTFGQLQLGPATISEPAPGALHRLAWEIEKRTSIDVQLEPVIVTPTSDTLHETPFLYLSGERELELPSGAGIEALRRFLTFGGFLLIDSAEGSTDGAFDGSVRKLISAVFPPVGSAKPLEIVPSDHVVYKSFYLLDRPLGRLAIAPAMEGGDPRRPDRRARTSPTTSAARGSATTSATTTSRASPAASASASSRSAWASTS